MSRLWLVRHGQAGAVDGDYDRLSEIGTRQARLLGCYFKSRGLDFNIAQSGTLQRQQQTLDAVLQQSVAERLQAPSPALNELPFQALARCWAAQQHPPLQSDPLSGNLANLLKTTLGEWINEGLDNTPISWKDYRRETLQWLDNFRLQHHANGEHLVVSSGGTIATILSALLDAPDLAMLRFNLQLRNTAVCELQLSPYRSHVISFNSVSHLECVENGRLITLI